MKPIGFFSKSPSSRLYRVILHIANSINWLESWRVFHKFIRFLKLGNVLPMVASKICCSCAVPEQTLNQSKQKWSDVYWDIACGDAWAASFSIYFVLKGSQCNPERCFARIVVVHWECTLQNRAGPANKLSEPFNGLDRTAQKNVLVLEHNASLSSLNRQDLFFECI